MNFIKNTFILININNFFFPKSELHLGLFVFYRYIIVNKKFTILVKKNHDMKL